MKPEYISKIESYVGDGLFDIPTSARADLVVNGVSVKDIREWAEIIRQTLATLSEARIMYLIPEGILANTVNYLESIRNNTGILTAPDQNANTALSNIISWMEALLSQLVPYTNLGENLSYESLKQRVGSALGEVQDKAAKADRDHKRLIKSTKDLEENTRRILQGVSSGTLSDKFKGLSNNWWNWLLMGLSTVAIGVAGYLLLQKTNELTTYVIAAFESGVLDYRVFLAKWLLTLPYLAIVSIAVLELRSRIKLRDLYVFRESVAGSLDGYTEVLLGHVENIENKDERSTARLRVLEFMIDSMLELTKTPSIKGEKQSMGVEVRDIGKMSISNE